MSATFNVSTSKDGTAALLSTTSAAEAEYDEAVRYVQQLSQGAGGESAGESLIADSVAGAVARKLCPNPATLLQCLEARAYDACYLEKNGVSCRELNMLLGTAVEAAARTYLASTRRSDTDNYFLPPTRRTAPKVVSKEVAALLVAAGAARR